jgi:hypothetical protein
VKTETPRVAGSHKKVGEKHKTDSPSASRKKSPADNLCSDSGLQICETINFS